MSRLTIVALSSLALLVGCAGKTDEQVIADAQLHYQQVKEDPLVLRYSPKDVVRAGESLARAERLANYWGNSKDVAHYAYLSQQYSAIGSENSRLAQNQEQAARLTQEHERLQQMLREATLINSQQQGAWLEDQLINLVTTETDRGLVMTLGDVLFEPGQSELGRSSNRIVLKLVQFMQINARRVVRIEGYTDNLGKAAENLELAKARAQAVADALIDLGIAAQRIQVVGYGEDYPVAENASSRGRAQNRRVEIVFSDDKGQLGAER
jgi:outer membrane protein OmpA-like peptidoglycan-associated protein